MSDRSDVPGIEIDTVPFEKPEGRVKVIPFDPAMTVAEFLELASKATYKHVINAAAYGSHWHLWDADSPTPLPTMGPGWAREHRRKEDSRRITEVGIGPGRRLKMIPGWLPMESILHRGYPGHPGAN